ncbi:MAG: hypothetical protein JWR83_285 [Aeromicrobium sp.]|nr:hypothetical protein [Aeromicrobium sp.]
MSKHIVVFSKIGKNRVLGKPSQEQPLWRDHADFMNALYDQGLIYLAGPWVDGSGAMVIVNADDVPSAIGLFRDDPWAINDIQSAVSAQEWDILMDIREP